MESIPLGMHYQWFTVVIFLTIISQLLIHYHDINRFTFIFLIHHDLFTLHYQCFTSIQIVVNNYQDMFHHYFFIISYSPFFALHLPYIINIHPWKVTRIFSTSQPLVVRWFQSPRNSEALLSASTAPQPVPHSWFQDTDGIHIDQIYKYMDHRCEFV